LAGIGGREEEGKEEKEEGRRLFTKGHKGDV